ncbi:MAG: hypothetical protein CGU28_16385 [Candidatus Dactylopiibacterium carminicum]|nr:MAG: hypothetical protein CGU28_16385 [Candidatus Dactylopiibacterium carminicum]
MLASMAHGAENARLQLQLDARLDSLIAEQSAPYELPSAASGIPLVHTPEQVVAAPLHVGLSTLWLLSSALLLLHILREWTRVLRLRMHQHPHDEPLTHALWPTISLLIPADGCSAEQTRRLDALANLGSDYPQERIHYVPMFDPADIQVALAVERLIQRTGDRVHPLPMMAGPNTTLASALHAAVNTSIGTALVILDRDIPLPTDWLRRSVTPLLDPGVGCVLTRAIARQPQGGLLERLSVMNDQADTLLATDVDALNLLMCGKARIRALRREAIKALEHPELQRAPDGAGLVLDITRLGWQSALLADIQHYRPLDTPDQIRSPRLNPALALKSMRMAALLLRPGLAPGARRQGGAAFFSSALPLIWLLCLASGIGLYFSGAPLPAGLAVLLCAATSFDPHGQPRPAFRIATAARMAGVREEIRLLPLVSLSFIDRLIESLRLLLRREPRPRAPHAEAVAVVEKGRS